MSADNQNLFDLGQGVHDLAIPVVLIAFLIGVPGLMMPNPTSVGQTARRPRKNTVRGILRVTRHPFLWGVAIWSPIPSERKRRSGVVILFGTFLALSVFGTFSIDAKRKRKTGRGWNAFANRTSNIPFGAIVSGRNQLKLGEYFDWRFLTAARDLCRRACSHTRASSVCRHFLGAGRCSSSFVPQRFQWRGCACGYADMRDIQSHRDEIVVAVDGNEIDDPLLAEFLHG